jgi:hypothetical protein
LRDERGRRALSYQMKQIEDELSESSVRAYSSKMRQSREFGKLYGG